MAIGETVKAPLYALGADGDYHKVYIENVAEQVVGLGRRPNTAYAAGDVVSCSTNNQLNLVCTTAGTTAATDLDISSKNVGDAITDGTVVWSCFSRMQAGVPIGFEYFSTNPNIPAGSIPLFGGEYSRTTYSALWEWVQTQEGYLLTEEEWQAKASANDGNVPYYSSGDGSITFRVPSLKCWVKGANGIEEVGSYLAAGLPNITGSFNVVNDGNNCGVSNAFTATAGGRFLTQSGVSNDFLIRRASFNASLSSSIYGNSDTVQPKSIVGMWLVKAYGTVSNVGSTDVSAIAQGLTEAETRIGQLENHGAGATVVETYNDGTNWYRKWSDGWLEQGGFYVHTANAGTISFIKPFANNWATVVVSHTRGTTTDGGGGSNLYGIDKTTTTSFTFSDVKDYAGTNFASGAFRWYACGQGA